MKKLLIALFLATGLLATPALAQDHPHHGHHGHGHHHAHHGHHRGHHHQ